MAGLSLAAASAGPSWYWYATRGLGVSTLLVLTATVVLGIATASRWSGEATPGFVPLELHRNLSLVGAVLLLAHVVTTLLDPFAQITIRDVLVPVGALYRPVWLGLGVVSMEILVAVTATSLLRNRIGPRLWRLIHWAAYASWPPAVLHTLGTGSDARAPWLIAVVAVCLASVLLALHSRLRQGPLRTLPVRALASVSAAGTAIVIGTWAFTGPLQEGWSARAGTPPAPATPRPVRTGPFSDSLVGIVAHNPPGTTQIAMRDAVDPDLTIAVRSADGQTETLPVVTVARGGKVLCQAPASPGSTLYTVCGAARLNISLYGPAGVVQGGGQVTGRLDSSGPLK